MMTLIYQSDCGNDCRSVNNVICPEQQRQTQYTQCWQSLKKHVKE
ncbi:MAG: hypothetical protein ACX932_01965 [Gammaproteobacteria bacterium]